MTAWDCFEASTDNNIAERARLKAMPKPQLDPEMRRVERELHRIAADRAAIEAEGFTLAWERPL